MALTTKPHVPSPQAIMSAVSVAQQLLAEVHDEDERLRLDTIEGETGAIELLDQLVECAVADSKLAELARARAARIEERSSRLRAVALRMLEALQLSKLERPLYTASISHPRKTVVTDEAQIPGDYMRTAVDMRALAKALNAGEEVPGASLGNPEPRLTLRTV